MPPMRMFFLSAFALDSCYLSYRKIKKLVYRRKYQVNKVLNNSVDKYHLMLSYDEIFEFYHLFQIIEHQIVELDIKGFIKLNYIFCRIFSPMNNNRKH